MNVDSLVSLLSFDLDDEDTNDNQSSLVSTSDENIRFAKEKNDFKRKYKEQIEQVRRRYEFTCDVTNMIFSIVLVTYTLAKTSK
jgi:uncharacterized membrane protein